MVVSHTKMSLHAKMFYLGAYLFCVCNWDISSEIQRFDSYKLLPHTSTILEDTCSHSIILPSCYCWLLTGPVDGAAVV